MQIQKNRKSSTTPLLKTAGFFLFIISLFFLLDTYKAAAQEKVQPQKVWADLFQRFPYPYTIPLPDAKVTSVDGTYIKNKELKSPLVHCRRCPDWAPEGGVWKINFSKGVFRVIHNDTTWRGLGTYVVAGDRILFANDPTCQDIIGLYRWRLSEGRLTFEIIDDGCAIRMRAANLSEQPWISCRPPNREAAITEHWPKPSACD